VYSTLKGALKGELVERIFVLTQLFHFATISESFEVFMLIKDYYSPELAGTFSGEAIIFKRGVGSLFNEIRECILRTNLIISPKKTIKKGKDATGSPGLADALNKALGASLTSLNWKPRKAPGAEEQQAKVDWQKSIPSGLSYGVRDIGLGLEIQFGNNFQFNEDLKRLSEAILEQTIVAGVCIVASDELAKYKADRGAFFSDSQSKMDRFLALFHGTGAAIIPGFVLIGVHPDGFTETTDGKFRLMAPIFGEKGVHGPVHWQAFGTIT
jgi:hypothetical protein